MKEITGLRHGQVAREWAESAAVAGLYVTVSGRCTITGKPYEIVVAREGLEKWLAGALIQDAFPHLSPEYREFLMSGITPQGWHEAELDREDDDEEEPLEVELGPDGLVPLDKLSDQDLEATVRCAKTGGNELMRREAREAQEILTRRQVARWEEGVRANPPRRVTNFADPDDEC